MDEEDDDDDDFEDDWEANLDKIADNIVKKSKAEDLPGLNDENFSSDDEEEKKDEDKKEDEKVDDDGEGKGKGKKGKKGKKGEEKGAAAQGGSSLFDNIGGGTGKRAQVRGR